MHDFFTEAMVIEITAILFIFRTSAFVIRWCERLPYIGICNADGESVGICNAVTSSSVHRHL